MWLTMGIWCLLLKAWLRVGLLTLISYGRNWPFQFRPIMLLAGWDFEPGIINLTSRKGGGLNIEFNHNKLCLFNETTITFWTLSSGELPGLAILHVHIATINAMKVMHFWGSRSFAFGILLVPDPVYVSLLLTGSDIYPFII